MIVEFKRTLSPRVESQVIINEGPLESVIYLAIIYVECCIGLMQDRFRHFTVPAR